MAGDQQMCLGCNDKPAVASNGTVPLCADCQRLAGNPRGVEFAKKAEEPKDEQPTNQPPS